ncbi:MAG: threonylcarbamoyl-AMP synthase, partial [Candidatus Latescibacteria bacterium]|nr:threonylcarbamoyl-AMP synthase [Candidatus Latescibacterota bacterium]
SSASIAQSLVETLGGPLTSTSANVSEQPPAQSAQEVHMQLGSHLDLIIDGGPSPQSQPSTILDISKAPPIILRTGMITKEELTPFVHK